MRRKRNPQTTIFEVLGKHPGPRVLEKMADILTTNSDMLDQVYADLVKKNRHDTGRKGMTAEQVVCCALLKQLRELSYDDLAYYLADSHSFRSFARLEPGNYPAKSTLQENIKALSEESWLAMQNSLIHYAQRAKIEKGQKIRLDSTVVQTDIHYPTEALLLWDGVRIITRWLLEGKALKPSPAYGYSDHRRVVKKRLLTIQNTTKQKTRQTAYRDMLDYAGRVIGYAAQAIPELEDFGVGWIEDYFRAQLRAEKLSRAIDLLWRVMDQTERRVFKGERVPASEKIVSLFETHTDIIVKGRRETEFGHKVFLTGGASKMILDCLIERGNPADSELFMPLLKRHEKRYGCPPRQSTADGGFASKSNLSQAKVAKVKDVVFAKKRGLSIVEMAKSTWVFRRLRNFRAGIEANISTLKRRYGLNRCNWSGWEGFKAYV